MIWLASFPRSGNTFARNILYHVYGLPSSEFHRQTEFEVDEGYERFPIVKTHLLPGQVRPADLKIPVVYLLRDGRDAITSVAHHTQDMVLPGTDFLQNMSEAIIAAEGSHFGGWSVNVLQWIKRADVVIRYEDLIADPKGQMERLRTIMDLPEPDWAKLPTFLKLKQEKNPYGVRAGAVEKEEEVAQKFFRKGKAGGWKEEMPPDLEALFWSCHGEVMEKTGYQKDGGWVDFETFQKRVEQIKRSAEDDRPNIKVLMEAQKLADQQRDGINRYVFSLCKAMDALQKEKGEYGHIDVDLLVNGEIVPLQQDLKITSKELEEREPPPWVVRTKAVFRKTLPDFLYYLLRRIYLWSPVRPFLKRKAMLQKWLQEQKNLRASNVFFTRYDLIHITLPQHYQYFRLMRHRFLVTVHDMTHVLFPGFHLKKNIRNARKGIRFLKKQDAQVIAVSEATKADLCRTEQIAESKVKVIAEAADAERFNRIYDRRIVEKVLEKYGLTGQVYFFSLATLEPRKNLRNTVAAFLKLKKKHPESSVKFVMAGKTGWKEKPEFLDHPDVMALGYVKDEDLSALFTAALGFCYVSHYEGFGLPLLEAMRCAAPVIYGYNSSMIEIVGDCGLAAKPDDAEDIAAKMEMLLTDAALCQTLKQNGYRRALEFSWEKAARETFDLYQSLIYPKTRH